MYFFAYPKLASALLSGLISSFPWHGQRARVEQNLGVVHGSPEVTRTPLMGLWKRVYPQEMNGEVHDHSLTLTEITHLTFLQSDKPPR